MWVSWSRVCLQCGRPGFNPWVGKIPWRRERILTPVFWPGEFHGPCSLWGRKEVDTTECLSLSLSVARDAVRVLSWVCSVPWHRTRACLPRGRASLTGASCSAPGSLLGWVHTGGCGLSPESRSLRALRWAGPSVPASHDVRAWPASPQTCSSPRRGAPRLPVWGERRSGRRIPGEQG